MLLPPVRVEQRASLIGKRSVCSGSQPTDFRVPAVGDYVIRSILEVLDTPWVDGTFTDDLVGFPSEHDLGPPIIMSVE